MLSPTATITGIPGAGGQRSGPAPKRRMAADGTGAPSGGGVAGVVRAGDATLFSTGGGSACLCDGSGASAQPMLVAKRAAGNRAPNRT